MAVSCFVLLVLTQSRNQYACMGFTVYVDGFLSHSPSLLSPSILCILTAYHLDISPLTFAFRYLPPLRSVTSRKVRGQVAVCRTRSFFVDMKCRVRALFFFDIISKTPHWFTFIYRKANNAVWRSKSTASFYIFLLINSVQLLHL